MIANWIFLPIMFFKKLQFLKFYTKNLLPNIIEYKNIFTPSKKKF